MQPAAEVWIAGHNVSGYIMNALGKGRLGSITVTDRSGGESDTVDMSLVRDNSIPIPPEGSPISVSLGYITAILPMGDFVSDEPETRGDGSGGHLMEISGSAADFTGPFKEERTESYDNKTVREIVSTVAGRQGRAPVVGQKVGAIKIPHIDQTQESDMHFLNRLADDLHATFKPMKDRLIFVDRGTTRSASGKLLFPIQPSGPAILDYHWRGARRGDVKSVKAYWHDQDEATRKEVTAGSGEPVKTLKRTYPTEAEAQRAAEAALKDGEASIEKASVMLIGNPAIRAEGRLVLPPVQPELAGAWTIQEAAHEISDSGYQTGAELERVR